jgi:hypothetical protein
MNGYLWSVSVSSPHLCLIANRRVGKIRTTGAFSGAFLRHVAGPALGFDGGFRLFPVMP